MQWKSIAGLESVKQLVWVAQHLSSTFYCLTTATRIVPKRGNYLRYPTALGEIWAGPHPEIIMCLWGKCHLSFSNLFLSLSFFLSFFLLCLFPHPLSHSFFLAFLHCCSFWPCPPTGGQWKPLRQARVSTGCTKLDLGTYRGPEGKPANYSSSHGGSCCLSPSICGHGESADRPACFYLPSISIQGDEACQGFTGTGNVSPTPGVSVV